MNSDAQLLERYAASGSEPAFAELVGRHLDLVYSAALRVVAGDRHLAEDVTQTVFAELARKAGRWPHGVTLAGWLYRCAWFSAVKAVRAERRRRAREQTALEMTVQDNESHTPWKDIAPVLEEAVNRLGSTDREAILLRFFRGQDLAAVGIALGLSEDAAQKRVRRALEKLRGYLGRRGITVSGGSLSTILLAEAVKAAPAGLTLAVATAATTAAVATGSGMVLSLMEIITMTKIKAVLAGAALVAGVGTPLFMQHAALQETHRENLVLRENALELDRLRVENERLTQSQVSLDELERFGNERAELQRLRGRVAELLRDRQQLEAMASTPPVEPALSTVGPGTFIWAADVSDAGMATPEATVETMFWAGLHGANDRMGDLIDVDRMRASIFESMRQLDPDGAPASPDEITLTPGSVTGVDAEQIASFAGFQVLSQQFHAPDFVELEVGISRAGGQIEHQRLILRQIEDEWKLDALATAALSDPSSFQARKTTVEPDGTETTESLSVILDQSTEARLVPDSPPQPLE